MHLFSKYLLSAYYVPGTVESPGYNGEKTDKEDPCFPGVYFLWKRQKMNCMCKPVSNQMQVLCK